MGNFTLIHSLLFCSSSALLLTSLLVLAAFQMSLGRKFQVQDTTHTLAFLEIHSLPLDDLIKQVMRK